MRNGHSSISGSEEHAGADPGASGPDHGLRLEGVSFSYGARRALEGVSFSVAPGRFCALLGPNGAGKSTLYALLTGLFALPEGRIWVAGFDVSRTPRAALARIGVVFQQTTLDLGISVRRNLSYFAALQGMSGSLSRRRIDEVLDLLDIADRADQPASDLNGGHRRRTEIARALIHRPSVLLLDEASAGLDAASRRDVTAHVHDLADRENLSVLWATHLVDEVRPSDDLVVLHRGRVLAAGRAGDIAGQRDLADTFVAMTAHQS